MSGAPAHAAIRSHATGVRPLHQPSSVTDSAPPPPDVFPAGPAGLPPPPLPPPPHALHASPSHNAKTILIWARTRERPRGMPGSADLIDRQREQRDQLARA